VYSLTFLVDLAGKLDKALSIEFHGGLGPICLPATKDGLSQRDVPDLPGVDVRDGLRHQMTHTGMQWWVVSETT